MRRFAFENNVDLKYVHVNCHRDRTLYEVVSEIIRQIEVLSYLERHKQYTINNTRQC